VASRASAYRRGFAALDPTTRFSWRASSPYEQIQAPKEDALKNHSEIALKNYSDIDEEQNK